MKLSKLFISLLIVSSLLVSCTNHWPDDYSSDDLSNWLTPLPSASVTPSPTPSPTANADNTPSPESVEP